MADEPLAVAFAKENPCAGGVLPEDKCINIRRRLPTKNGCLCKFEGKEGRTYVDWKGLLFNKKENWASRYNDYWYDWVDLSREALPDEKEFEKTC